MDLAVFQDCVKSMDLRQRFQKLQDEIYILNKTGSLFQILNGIKGTPEHMHSYGSRSGSGLRSYKNGCFPNITCLS